MSAVVYTTAASFVAYLGFLAGSLVMRSRDRLAALRLDFSLEGLQLTEAELLQDLVDEFER